MSNVNIANFVVYDLASQFNFVENHELDNEIVGLVADHWNKKHFVSGTKNLKFNHSSNIRQKFII